MLAPGLPGSGAAGMLRLAPCQWSDADSDRLPCLSNVRVVRAVPRGGTPLRCGPGGAVASISLKRGPYVHPTSDPTDKQGSYSSERRRGVWRQREQAEERQQRQREQLIRQLLQKRVRDLFLVCSTERGGHRVDGRSRAGRGFERAARCGARPRIDTVAHANPASSSISTHCTQSPAWAPPGC